MTMIPRFARARIRAPSLSSAFLLGFVMLCFLLVGLDGWRTWQGRRLAIDADYAETTNLVRSLAQHAHDTVQAADTILVGIRERVEHDGLPSGPVTRLQTLGPIWIEPLPAIHGLFVFDAEGVLVVNSASLARGALNARRENYFEYHRTHADRGVHVDGLLRCVTNCTWVFSVSRRIDMADGRFGGVAMASISIDALKQFYAPFAKGDHGTIGLLSTNGIILVRQPGDAKTTGMDTSNGNIFRNLLPRSPAGSFEEVYPSDRIRRLGSYRKVDRYPLVVVVAHGFDEVLAGWQSDALLRSSVNIVVAIAVVLLSWRFARQIKRRQEADVLITALNRELSAQASTDSLTGIFNRRRFDETLNREWQRAARRRSPLSLLFIDVDRFKLFNDRYGHQHGDECLRAITHAIAGTVRCPGDLVARYGGEEIGVLLPDTGEDMAAQIAEHVRDAIEKVGMPHSDNIPFRVVTASLGVATMTPMLDGTMAEALIGAADTSLYEAKRAGRNRVVSWRGRRLSPLSVARHDQNAWRMDRKTAV